MNFESLQKNIEEVSTSFAAERAERQQRRELDAADFDRLCDAGLHLVGLPVDRGGLWSDVREVVRPTCDALQTLARGDSSVALVSAMHPAVLSYWLTAPEELQSNELWQQQCAAIFESVEQRHWWGTMTSEPGSGGDVTRSSTKAEPVDDRLQYRLTGQKHFGSGSGMMSFMVTTAQPDGEEEADWFFVDTRNIPWDGSQGLRLIAEWDGHGMSATQSHAMAFESMPATRMAWTRNLLSVAARAGGFIGCLFTSVIVGIVDEAVATAAEKLNSHDLSEFEQVEWTRVQMEHWQIRQAMNGMIAAVETQDDPRYEVLLGKTSTAELAESVLLQLCRIVGGSTFSRRSPFGYWFEDVRALGFLRPPWSLAFDSIKALSPKT